MPTGVRIDQAKVTQWSNDLVRFTDNFPTEKLERVYSAMNKVITIFSSTWVPTNTISVCPLYIVYCSYYSR